MHEQFEESISNQTQSWDIKVFRLLVLDQQFSIQQTLMKVRNGSGYYCLAWLRFWLVTFLATRYFRLYYLIFADFGSIFELKRQFLRFGLGQAKFWVWPCPDPILMKVPTKLSTLSLLFMKFQTLSLIGIPFGQLKFYVAYS